MSRFRRNGQIPEGRSLVVHVSASETSDGKRPWNAPGPAQPRTTEQLQLHCCAGSTTPRKHKRTLTRISVQDSKRILIADVQWTLGPVVVRKLRNSALKLRTAIPGQSGMSRGGGERSCGEGVREVGGAPPRTHAWVRSCRARGVALSESPTRNGPGRGTPRIKKTHSHGNIPSPQPAQTRWQPTLREKPSF